MRKTVIPFGYCRSVYDVPTAALRKLGVKCVLVDLDNTLDAYHATSPSPRAFELKKRLEEAGIDLIIVSNNKGGRVSYYASSLGIKAKCLMLKPFAFRLNRLIKRLGYGKDEVILIGDQIQTDIIAGNRAKIRTILTEPLDESIEPPWTKWNRHFDKPKREKMRQLGLLKDITEEKGANP